MSGGRLFQTLTVRGKKELRWYSLVLVGIWYPWWCVFVVWLSVLVLCRGWCQKLPSYGGFCRRGQAEAFLAFVVGMAIRDLEAFHSCLMYCGTDHRRILLPFAGPSRSCRCFFGCRDPTQEQHTQWLGEPKWTVIKNKSSKATQHNQVLKCFLSYIFSTS